MLGLLLVAASASALFKSQAQWRSIDESFDLVDVEHDRVVANAEKFLKIEPVTITAFPANNSEGGPHDYFSEGKYWWPNPADPEGPYIRKDGQTNPQNFMDHQNALVRFNQYGGALVSAYLATGEEKYAAHFVKHLRAWFINEDTKMNPHMKYSQAIKGVASGRSIGVIDGLHIIEVARGVKRISGSPSFPREDEAKIKAWFAEYLKWLNTDPKFGLVERKEKNNHAVCWAVQAASFADLVGDKDTIKWVQNEFKTVYLPNMQDRNGSFPQELARTKPYAYSLFQLDAMGAVAQVASTKDCDLWSFQLSDGRGMKKAMDFIFPYVENKDSWPKAADIMFYDRFPQRHSAILYAGLHFHNPKYVRKWVELDADPEDLEMLKFVSMRYPLLWVEASELKFSSKISAMIADNS